MNVQNPPDLINPIYEECLRLRNCSAWFLALGIVLMAVGVAAIGSAFIATLTTVLVFGILLVGGGIVQIVNAFMGRSWKGFFLHLLAGLLHLVVGELMIEHPLLAAEGLTVILAAAFLVGGALRIVYVLVERFAGWGWVLANGIVTFLLGVSIWRQWPESSLWVIGLFVGIDLIFNGWSWVMLGLLVKAPAPGSPPLEAKAPTSAPAGMS